MTQEEIFFVNDSAIEGRGLFTKIKLNAGERIKINTPIISFNRYDEIRLKLGAGKKKEHFLTTDKHVFDLRNSVLRFTNHSNNPNLDWDNENLIVIRDIREGEELTINYGWVNYRWN